MWVLDHVGEEKKGGLVVHGVLATTALCHVGGHVNNMDGCTISVSMREVCEDRNESLAMGVVFSPWRRRRDASIFPVELGGIVISYNPSKETKHDI